jgi:phospholipid/cholesterol/gamma-HCH transport system substrate-binding protein
METRANHFIIGSFVLAITLFAFTFIYWMRHYSTGNAGDNYYVVFDGSVQGLTEASSVLFNGLRTGAVTSIEILPEDSRKMRATITLRQGIPVRENSRARVSQIGLAGMVALEITPGTPDSPMLKLKAGDKLPIIRADRASSESPLAAAADAVNSAQAMFNRINDLIANNEESIRNTVRHVESVSAMADENKENIAVIIKNVRDMSEKLSDLAAKLDKAVDKTTLALVDDPKSVVAQAQQAVQSFRQLADKLDKSVGDQSGALTQSAQRSLREFELFMKDARRLADNVDRVVQRLDQNPSGYLLGGSQTPQYKPSQ